MMDQRPISQETHRTQPFTFTMRARRLGRWLIAPIAAALLMSAAPRATAVGAVSEPGRLIMVQVPVRAASDSAAPAGLTHSLALPPGSRIVVYDPSKPDTGITNLTPSFAAAGRPDVSFDGKRLLFVGRRQTSDPPRVWEMDLASRTVRTFTHPTGWAPRYRFSQISAAVYLSTLYTLDAEKPVHQIALCGRANGTVVESLYTCQLDGTNLARITFDPNGVSDPLLLSDGRLVYSRSLRGERGKPSDPVTATDLMTVNTDGTDVFPFAAVHETAAVRSMPCETTDEWIVYVESIAGGAERGGSLVAVSRSRPLHTRRVIAQDPDGLYYSPSAAADGRLLAAYRPKSGGSYGIYLLDPQSGERVAQVFDDPMWHEIEAVLLTPRREPAGRSSVVNKGVDHGFLYCMDASLTDREGQAGVDRGRIDRFRVYGMVNEKAPVPADAARPGGGPPGEALVEKLLGEIPVESDGSFFLQVPAHTPLRLQTIDPAGQILQDMRSWIWVMPKEARGCIGCHEDRELTPPNRHAAALRRSPYLLGFDGGRQGLPAAKHEPRSDRRE